MTAALEIRGLRKHFGGNYAVDGLDLEIAQGEFHALLGPNGAGKTTTLRIVAGLLRPDYGTVRVAGHDVSGDPLGAKRVLAYLPDEPLLYAKLTALEYLEFVAGLWRLDAQAAHARARELLEMLGLAERMDERVEGYSRGMRQKLAFAGALIHEPRVMILDEPLTGLDAAAARQVKGILAQRARDGCAIVLTTHILEIAERLAERISIIRAGRIVAKGTMEELRALSGSRGTLEDIFLELTSEDTAGGAP
ncbi:MAG TPA: ABC transporter ATP-binding protein [Usitatibacter sp.]|nr:ABC transporter ATP-binding protein [Usitatibacter sp.]